MSPSTTNTTPDEPAERIEDVDVSTEMENSFLEYAYSVIYSRALPDARDGLKPVQRRILYQMSEMGLRPDRGHVKSARVTGEVMGKLHPHGDSAIYDAMVRMAQPFTLRVPLIDGHGNFGSLDDGPAAPRYTEARLAASALAMVEGLDEDVVDFVPNYDNAFMQPAVLPAAFPNLLVNGASGIAVGMATNMVPHNLIEVVGAARHLIDHPDATLDDLMAFVPGPDLPTGGTIIGLSGVKDAYLTGRGSFKTRARVSVESLTPRKSGLVVSIAVRTASWELRRTVCSGVPGASVGRSTRTARPVVESSTRHGTSAISSTGAERRLAAPATLGAASVRSVRRGVPKRSATSCSSLETSARRRRGSARIASSSAISARSRSRSSSSSMRLNRVSRRRRSSRM